MRCGKNKQRNASAKADVANEERSMVWADETCLNTRTKGATLGISPPRVSGPWKKIIWKEIGGMHIEERIERMHEKSRTNAVRLFCIFTCWEEFLNYSLLSQFVDNIRR